MADSKITRRWLIGGAGAGLAAIAFTALGGRNLYYAAITEDVDGAQISVTEAHARARSGEVFLIDIRRPEEWAASGSGEGAIRLDMRREDFTQALLEITGGATDRPVALICARGVRSARLTNRLVEAGFSQVIDVPEGMFGSAAGPGWHAAGLPLDRS